MNIKPIRSERNYRAALKRIDELIALDPKEGTDALDLISTLVESYENIHYPISMQTLPDQVLQFSDALICKR